MVRKLIPLAVAAVAAYGSACGSNAGTGNGHEGPDAAQASDAGLESATLVVSPPTAEIAVGFAQAEEHGFSAELVRADGSREDVTHEASFELRGAPVGIFDGPALVISGLAAGRASVRARYAGLWGDAELVVRVAGQRVDESAPDDAPDRFDAAAENPELAPEIAYPAVGTLVPPNLGDFEVHATGPSELDLFEFAIVSDFAEVRVYTAASEGIAWVPFSPTEWALASQATAEDVLHVSVRGLSTAASEVGISEPVSVGVIGGPIRGGLYYWASTSDEGEAGIFRHDMARPGEAAEPFYTTSGLPQGRTCVACHVLSRDGSTMAITYDGGDGPASMLSVDTGEARIPSDGSFRWNFAAFTPEADEIFTVFQGDLTLRSSDDGAALATVPTEGYATHVDVAPAGDAIAYVRPASASNDWTFTGGEIVVQSYDSSGPSFGAPSAVVTAGSNNYYPSFSPDGEWILFNRSTGNAYDDQTAELWVMPVDGSADPIRLDLPNAGDSLTNSWARWAPFQELAGEEQEPLFWLTFSSKRDFGVRLTGANRPQLWMAPFFPARTRAGDEPSAPAFRLPFQALGSNNHIAQWTERVLPPID
jgi:hypothetical protein